MDLHHSLPGTNLEKEEENKSRQFILSLSAEIKPSSCFCESEGKFLASNHLKVPGKADKVLLPVF
jgi:hypothetical protein